MIHGIIGGAENNIGPFIGKQETPVSDVLKLFKQALLLHFQGGVAAKPDLKCCCIIYT